MNGSTAKGAKVVGMIFGGAIVGWCAGVWLSLPVYVFLKMIGAL